ncbi:MAG: ATP-binding protein [bacterium]
MEKKERILLIVDGNLARKDPIHQAAEPFFHRILSVTNAGEAMQAFRKQNPHMVMIFDDRDDMDSLSIAKELRKESDTVLLLLFADPAYMSGLIQETGSASDGIQPLPLDTDKLITSVRRLVNFFNQTDQVNEGRKKELEITEQRDYSREILQVISQTTTLFFRTKDYERNIQRILEITGKVTRASRVYVYRNFLKGEDEYTSRIYEWTAEGIMPAIGNLSVTNQRISSSGFERWVNVMKKEKGHISGLIRNFELTEQRVLSEHGIKSILAIPIFVEDSWWGFIGIDDCMTEREWFGPEIAALEILANNLGLAIHKTEIEEKLQQLNKALEEKVLERTKALKKEMAERVMTEALLKDSEEKYRVIYENATYGIMLIQKGRIVLLNPAIVDILEYLPRKLIGNNFSKIVVREDRELVKKQFDEVSADMQDIFQVRVITGKGKNRWLELKPTKIDWYGAAACLVFVSNISARKHAEEELYRLNQELERRVDMEIRKIEEQQQLLVQKSKLESIGELSAGLAHEINQPLVSISMGLDNMLMNIDDPACDKEYLKEKISLLFHDIDRINQIIEHVRIFSRDQQRTDSRPVEVRQAIRDAISLVEKMLEGENFKLEMDCMDQQDIFVYGNQYKLEQVILNLISNARFAVNKKERDSDTQEFIKQIKLRCHLENEKVLIDVWDNGIGIPPEILTNIFNPFFTTKSEMMGTGLGLSISYGIIREMKGDILAESIEHEYTNMRIELPKYIKA